MSVTDEDRATDRLARIEERLARIEAMLERADQAIGAFVTGPGITRMFRALARGKDE